jgi:hypothetical protein
VLASTCLFAFEGEAQVTYAKDVAPILQENCQECHRPGSIGPMALLTYEDAKQFAPLIKYKVANRLMPPWHIDKTIGIQDFKNDISLSDEQIETIVRWVDSGAPLGNPADMPPPKELPSFTDLWQFEKLYGRPPDLVMENPPFRLVANGLDQWPNLENRLEGLNEERYMMAIEAHPKTPETRYVFHHGGPTLIQDGESTGLMNSPAGKVGEILPSYAGKLFKPGAKISYSLHLFPMGKEVDVVMQWGVWFYPKGEKPKYETRGEVQVASHHGPDWGTGTLRAHDLLLPPNSTTMTQGTRVLDKPWRIHSVRAHMHLRGKYQTLEAIYPNGKREVIAKINWQHKWHTAFTYEDWAQPLLPKGTVLITTSWLDNTLDQASNPDPNQWVVYGQRGVDEMMHMWIGMTEIPQEDFEAMVAEREQLLRARPNTVASTK